jgi:ATP-dependent RNA helicase DDX46/PRP5
MQRTKRSFTTTFNTRKLATNTPWKDDEDDEGIKKLSLLDSGTVETKQAPAIDPLDEFMINVDAEVHELLYKEKRKKGNQKPLDAKEREFLEKDDYELEEERAVFDDSTFMDESQANFLALQKKAKRKELQKVNHAKIHYEDFRKDFYIESPEISKLSEKQVTDLRARLDDIKIRGRKAPCPVLKWTQCGLNLKVLEVIKRLKYSKPTPVQAQAMPCIMSGRDVIAIAKTGSGTK